MQEPEAKGVGPLKVPDVKGWKHEPGEAFLCILLLASVIVLGSVVGYFTIDVALSSFGMRLVGDVVILAFLWLVVFIFFILLQDHRATYHRRRNTYSRFMNVPRERIDEDIRSVLGSMGLGFERRLVSSLLERAPFPGPVQVYQYRLEGAGFSVHLEHFGPAKEGSEEESNLLLVGPITREEHQRILAFIRNLASVEDREPPSIHVYGTRPREGP